jgi:hypothetical protein
VSTLTISAVSGAALEPVSDSAHEVLTRMLEILAPGGSDFVAFLECYFDESGSHDGSPVLCVAGYLFDQDQCKALDLKWKASLERYKLPFFRMSACAHNTDTVKVYPFEHLSAAECIAVEKEMISHINEHALLGVAVAVNENDYNALLGNNSPAGTPYWPAPGSADTELGVLMEPEVCHGEAEVYTRVQA